MTPLGRAIQPAYSKQFGLDKHSSASQIRNVVGAELWDSLLTFSVVRHPITRLQSLYSWLGGVDRAGDRGRWGRLAPRSRPVHREPWSWPTMQAYVASASFSDFIRRPEVAQGFVPQFDVLADQGQCIVDRVLRYENLEAEFSALMLELGIPAQLGWRNRSASGPRPAVSEADQRLLTDLFQSDFEAFGYDAAALR